MKKFIVCVATVLVACSLNATVHKVKVSDGAEVLKSTIAEAAAGDTVLVQEGKFIGNFTMKEGVQVIGGWDETFTSKKDYATILDANADGRVLNQPAAFSTLTVWSNFTIQNGKLTAQPADKGAAGVFLNVKGRVQDCLIQNNVVDAAVTDDTTGGGVSCNSGNAEPDTVAYNCIIKNNSATHGGGVRVNGKGVVVYKCVIEDNQTTNNVGGGVQLHNGSHLVNCIVRNNKANGNTGGVHLTGGNASTIMNCLIVGNESAKMVGGISMEGNLANVINCTIVGNKQKQAGATASLSGVKVNNSKTANGTLFVNNIVWGNFTADTLATQGVYYLSKYDNAKGQRSYNAIIGQAGDEDQTGTTSIILTKENPGFADPENGDFTLVAGSKLIDFGSDVANTLPIDLAGNKRIQGKSIDLGAYEAVPTPVARKEFTFVAGEAADSDPAMFAITWGADGSRETVKMTKKEDGIYVAEILPTVDSVVLVRCATGATEIIEGVNVWNQSESYPLFDTMCFGEWTEEGTFTLTYDVEYKYTEYVNWQIKYGNTWVWSDNMEKVEDGLFKLEILWEGTGFNVKSDENPIKKDWFALEELTIGEEVHDPVTVDVYLKVVDDETVMIGVGVEPSAPASGPTVDETGITVNGRKYGFPVRLVK